MANQLAENPIYIDDFSADVTIFGHEAKIAHVEFAGYTLNADKIVLKNINGKVVTTLDGADDLETVRTGKIGWVNGLKMLKADQSLGAGGRITIYFE